MALLLYGVCVCESVCFFSRALTRTDNNSQDVLHSHTQLEKSLSYRCYFEHHTDICCHFVVGLFSPCLIYPASRSVIQSIAFAYPLWRFDCLRAFDFSIQFLIARLCAFAFFRRFSPTVCKKKNNKLKVENQFDSHRISYNICGYTAHSLFSRALDVMLTCCVLGSKTSKQNVPEILYILHESFEKTK